MPTKTNGKNVVKTESQKSLINRYGGNGGLYVLFGSRMRDYLGERGQGDEPNYVHMQTDEERIVTGGRYRPK
jgi:hypothetical protein